MKILIFNRGSSTLKSCLYELSENSLPERAPAPLWKAQIVWSDSAEEAELTVKVDDIVFEQAVSTVNDPPVSKMLEALWSGKTQVISDKKEIQVAGHRVVHGGTDYSESVFITPKVKQSISQQSLFAPVHNSLNLKGIADIEEIIGSHIPQVAVFDTAFHRTIPPAASVYPGPYEWFQRGIRRYGFHGLSHRYCARRAAQMLDRSESGFKVITCHLGNGCSLAAVADGKSVDTTMGLTPLEGLMMGSRSGSIDPGILLHLLREEDISPETLDDILNNKSGLLGVSGVSSDMRTVLEASRKGNMRAKLAIEIFVHRLRAGIGQMFASIEGADALVFTAGIGENSACIREKTCQAFTYLGIGIDTEKNYADPVDEDISTSESNIRVLVIDTKEAWEIARECWRLMTKGQK